MGQFLIVSKIDRLQEYLELAKEYQVGFEYNDFFWPDILDDEIVLKQTIEKYKKKGVPDYCTLHGVFFDIIPFSNDSKIRNVSKERMKQSLEIAREIGAKGVVFHTNAYPLLQSEIYDAGVIQGTASCFRQLLTAFPDVNIYLENMFDADAHYMVAIAEELKEYKNFGLCLDYAHAVISGTDIDKWVNEVAPVVKHVHINDNDLKKDSHLAVGDGEIDWELFKKHYEKYFKDCSILVETTLPENQRKSLDYLKKLLGK